MQQLISREHKARPVSRKLERHVTPTGVERMLGAKDMVVSKTDPTGRITYCNDVFMRIASMSEGQLLGAPHSIIRHPDMPRCVFKLLWDTLGMRQEVFAYVVNMAANGDHYWVFAHATPSFDNAGNVVGYHSMRRAPNQRTVRDIIKPLYAQLLAIEAKHGDRKAGMKASSDALAGICRDKGLEYAQLVHLL